ncbi:hypothetical protein F5Y03DRAFT_405311 [Xylaria venustula]|nr:hypothetical protein F5Y03DRAFT_405311 [Xylaria venustula]
MNQQVDKLLEEIEAVAKANGVYDPYLDQNHAKGSQEVMKSYGKENYAFLKETAQKYDPTGLFRKLIPGGFKLRESTAVAQFVRAKTLYEVLSVSSDADAVAIQKAFKTLSLKWHPDKANVATVPSSGETRKEREAREKQNHDRFTRMVEARDILTDPARRQKYDHDRREIKHRKSSRRSESSKESSKQSKPSTSRKDSKNHSSSRSTARQGTTLGQEIENTRRRLERVGHDLFDWASIFRTRIPSPESRFKGDYLDVLMLHYRVVAIDLQITEDLIFDLRDLDTALFEADMHIKHMKYLIGDLMSTLDLPAPLIYFESSFAFRRFLDV